MITSYGPTKMLASTLVGKSLSRSHKQVTDSNKSGPKVNESRLFLRSCHMIWAVSSHSCAYHRVYDDGKVKDKGT